MTNQTSNEKSALFGALTVLLTMAAGLLAYSGAVVPDDFEVTTHVVGADPQSNVRIVQISDLHIQQFGEKESRLTQIVQDLKPDVIALTGDILDDPNNQQPLEAFLGALEPIPRVAVLGNWEHWSGVDLERLRAAYEATPNSHLLVNQSAKISIRGNEITFVGLDDFTAGAPNRKLLQGPTGTMRIVLQHSPGLFHRSSQTADQICLSGHTHGGQVTFFGKALWTPPGSGDFVAGWYQTAECRLYVSRGVGMSILPIRFGPRPEITVLDL